ncbi:MAG: hypothetical protein IPN33_00425 [Saprospiraceae bacterium]|nr:hypothetical protein [Saprospiraceae bacterium]
MKLRFRDRIALFTALAAAATIGLVFLVVYGVVYYTAINHLDNDLWKEKEEVLRELEWTADSILLHAMPEWEEKEHEQIEVNPTFIQIVDVNGRLLFRSTNLQQDILLFNPNLQHYTYFNSRIKEQRIRQGQFPIVNKKDIVIGASQCGYFTAGIGRRFAKSAHHPMDSLPAFVGRIVFSNCTGSLSGHCAGAATDTGCIKHRRGQYSEQIASSGKQRRNSPVGNHHQ